VNHQVFCTVGRILFGAGTIEQVADEIRRLGSRRVMVITDPGIVAAGLTDGIVRCLDDADISHVLFSEVESEPSVRVAEQSGATARAFQPDVVIGMGGGSALDIAKVTAVMMTNTGQITDWFGIERVEKPGLPLIQIPTTAGTGSEVTAIAVLSDHRNRIKKGIVSRHLLATVALLDPELTLGLPPSITAATGLDALMHAVESFTGRHATYLTEPLALEAIRLISKSLIPACRSGATLDVRSDMLKGSLLAGMAFANTQTGGAHACALALGARCGLPHGQAVSLMAPSVMRFNLPAAKGKYARIASAMGLRDNDLPETACAIKAIDEIASMIGKVGFKQGLRNYGVAQEDFKDLAEGAMAAERLWDNNPRRASHLDVEEIFRTAWDF